MSDDHESSDDESGSSSGLPSQFGLPGFGAPQQDGMEITRQANGKFGVRWSDGCYISKLHSEAVAPTFTPGAGSYTIGKMAGDPSLSTSVLFGTEPKDVPPTKFEGKASAEVMPSICSPGPKYNPDCENRTTRAPTHVIGTGRRPPLTCPSKGPGPGAYTPFEAPQLYPPEFSFGNSPDQNRFAQNQHPGDFAAKSVPTLDTPGPVYQIRRPERLNGQGHAGPFDHADRFEPLNHLMISEEHNRKMRGGVGSYPAPDAYSYKTFPEKNKFGLDAPGAKEKVYRSGEQVRGHAKQFLGAAMKVGLGEEGHGPAMYSLIDTTLKEDGPKIPRAKRAVGTKDALSQMPGPGAYKPSLKTGHVGGLHAFGLRRFPQSKTVPTPGPVYDIIPVVGGCLQQGTMYDKPAFTVGKGSRGAKVYISKKHTQDVKGLDSPGPIYHFRKDKDLGTGHAALIGTAERNRSEAKRYISALHGADTAGKDTPGPGAYGDSVFEKERGTGGYSFGTSERGSFGPNAGKAPGPGSYGQAGFLNTTLRKGGFTFGGGPPRQKKLA